MIKLILFTLILFFISMGSAQAIYDPLSVNNNKIGIHILFPEELSTSAELINSSGGDWGYVTIPIQAGDKDIVKWQNFMDEARNLHVIPILRLATEGDYFDKTTWRKPKFEDVLDFANFLDSLDWPVKNRYIIVFNEVNRADEWNGAANPAEYAQILNYANEVFKSKNDDYFIISSGMDNAASTGNGTYSQYDYFLLMNEGVYGIFDRIDGFSSHAYPNPGFSQLPTTDTPRSIYSFLYEIRTINSLTNKKLPIFITETGWDQSLSSDNTVGGYFTQAFEGAWNNENIVAITPFLLNSGPGPFEKFSLLSSDGNRNEIFNKIKAFKKTQGSPVLNEMKLSNITQNSNLPVKRFAYNPMQEDGIHLKFFVKWLLFPL